MKRSRATSATPPRHVSLVAIPEAAVSTLSGIFDVLNAPKMMGETSPPFRVEIVGERTGPLELVSGVPVGVQRSIDAIEETDVAIVPSIVLPPDGWRQGRYARIVQWLQAQHRRGAVLCSACSGIFLLAETGLWEGRPATVHYGYAAAFARTHPGVPIDPERVLVIAGEREELVTSGASMTWHDLVLYLLARYAGATTAQAVARYFALQWHQDGLTPYIVFDGRRDHGDVAIEKAQAWVAKHFSVADPIEGMTRAAGLTDRTFKRRFTAATGLPPIAYVQRLRIEDAKRRLERTDTPVDQISWQVGYEEPAFFRRLFKRITGLAPGAYRRRFQRPDFVKPGTLRR